MGWVKKVLPLGGENAFELTFKVRTPKAPGGVLLRNIFLCSMGHFGSTASRCPRNLTLSVLGGLCVNPEHKHKRKRITSQFKRKSVLRGMYKRHLSKYTRPVENRVNKVKYRRMKINRVQLLAKTPLALTLLWKFLHLGGS